MENTQLEIMDVDGSNGGMGVANAIQGGSVSDLGGCQVDANQSTGLVIPSPTTPPPTPNTITGISEDENLHVENCPFEMWIAQRKKLLTVEELAKHIFETLIKTRGKRKTAGQRDQIWKEAFEKASSPVIAGYIADSRDIHTSYKEVMRERCECPQAMLAKSQQVQMPSMPMSIISIGDGQPLQSVNLDAAKEDELEKLGLDLSESESDDDSTDTY